MLTAAIVAPTAKSGRSGYRRITDLLRMAGRSVNVERVQRMWRGEGLKVPSGPPRRWHLWLADGSRILLRAEDDNHVWARDLVSGTTHDGRKLRLLGSRLVTLFRSRAWPWAPWRRRPTDDVALYPIWLYEARRRRRRTLLAWAAIAIAVALAFMAILVVRARTNYLQGEQAFRAGDYQTAIVYLRSAGVAGIPYEHARSLLDQATALANDETEYTSSLPGTSALTAESRLLQLAAARFTAGHPAQAEALIAGWPVRFPADVLLSRLTTGDGAVAAVLLLAGAHNALAAGDWQTAATEARGVLIRYPACAPAAALVALADRRVRAETFARQAFALAHAGRWRPALTVLQTALAIDPSYPGAAALRAHVETVLGRQAAAAAAKRRAAAAAKRRAAAAAAAAAAPVTAPPPVTPPAPPPP